MQHCLTASSIKDKGGGRTVIGYEQKQQQLDTHTEEGQVYRQQCTHLLKKPGRGNERTLLRCPRIVFYGACLCRQEAKEALLMINRWIVGESRGMFLFFFFAVNYMLYGQD